MKIIFLSDDFPPDNLGGAGTIAQSLAQGLNALGHEVFVITTVREKGREGVNKREGLTIYNIYSNYHERWRAFLSIYNPMTISKISRIIRQIKPDIVHAHNIHYHISYHSLRIAKKACCKVILTAHDVMIYSYGKTENEAKISLWSEFKKYRFRFNPFRNMAIRYYLKFVDKIVAVSESLARALKNNNIYNVSVIHNGIDLNTWSPNSKLQDEFIIKHGLKDKKIILFGGRLSQAKGATVAVIAMSKIISEEPNIVLLVVGQQNKSSQSMIDLAKDKGVSSNLVFTGWLNREEMKLAYFSSDIVIVPSLCLDLFPTVNLEAMAAKKPVVGTCFGGTPEAIIDGFNGYIVNPNSVNLLAEKMLDLLKNPEKAKKFGTNGFKKVGQDFSLDRQVNKYLSLYEN